MRQKTKVFFLNAPPGAGKDTAAEFLSQKTLNSQNSLQEDNIPAHTYFKRRLYDITGAIYGISSEKVKEINDNRDLKELPHEAFGGKSVRQSLIEVSETVIKPVYGSDYFGRSALQDLKTFVSDKSATHIFISDCGFTDEVRTIVQTNLFDCYLLQFSRVGCTFEGDSRSYIDWFGGDDHRFWLTNDTTMQDFEDKLSDIIKPLLK